MADARARRASWRRVKQGPGWAVVGVIAVVLMVFGVAQGRDARTPEERVEAISKQLACPICDGESVFESRNNASVSIRNEIRTQVDGGRSTDAQIIAYIEERFGERVVLVPKAEGVDALVWILPVVALVGGIAGLALAFRHWQRAAGTVPTDADRALVGQALVDQARADQARADQGRVDQGRVEGNPDRGPDRRGADDEAEGARE